MQNSPSIDHLRPLLFTTYACKEMNSVSLVLIMHRNLREKKTKLNKPSNDCNYETKVVICKKAIIASYNAVFFKETIYDKSIVNILKLCYGFSFWCATFRFYGPNLATAFWRHTSTGSWCPCPLVNERGLGYTLDKLPVHHSEIQYNKHTIQLFTVYFN